ncbi:MAG: cation transporter [Snowella sp.]|nr:cation transporter [Snowella sp.]
MSTNLSMAILGIGVGLWIESDAVMLDGFFNTVNLIMACATLYISRLLQKPEGKQFNFGYTGFVPLLNLCKGLLVFGVSIFAFTGSLGALFHGGVPAKTGTAVIYAAIAATVCLIVALIQRNLANKTQSPIVIVDAQNWLINGMISLAVGIAFGFATWLGTTPFKAFVPYSDPTIVIILVLISFPIPISVILTSVKQLMLGAPRKDLQQRIYSIIQEGIKAYPCERYVLRMAETGSVIYLHFYWLLPSNHQGMPLTELDRIRQEINQLLQQEFPEMIIDLIFTQDQGWFTMMNEERGSQSLQPELSINS